MSFAALFLGLYLILSLASTLILYTICAAAKQGDRILEQHVHNGPATQLHPALALAIE
jgi:hypothetical protein